MVNLKTNKQKAGWAASQTCVFLRHRLVKEKSSLAHSRRAYLPAPAAPPVITLPDFPLGSSALICTIIDGA